MRRFMYTLAAVAFSLTLAANLQAGPRPTGHTNSGNGNGNGGHGHGGSGGMGGNPLNPGNPGHGHGGSGAFNTTPVNPVGGNAQGRFGGFNGTPKAGKNVGYQQHRPSRWGTPVWNAALGCNCYYDSDADCYYYYCGPDDTYYPLDYCPSGRYDYQEP